MCGRRTGAEDHRHLTANQIGCQFREAVIFASSPEKFDCNVLIIDIAGLVEAVTECRDQIYVRLG
jgi:hypothetical protein